MKNRRLEKEWQQMRKALEWYADIENYEIPGGQGVGPGVLREQIVEGISIKNFVPDRGQRARDALLATEKDFQMSDKYTMEMRMCDDDGMVSHTPIEEKRDISLLDPKLTYLDRLNWLRNLTLRSQGEENDTIEEPFACTGHAHLAGEHIRCTSKAHQLKRFDVLMMG